MWSCVVMFIIFVIACIVISVRDRDKPTEVLTPVWEKLIGMLSNRDFESVGQGLAKILHYIAPECLSTEVIAAVEAWSVIQQKGGPSDSIIDSDKQKKAADAVSSFRMGVNLLDVSGRYRADAAARGLDFGIITSGAADLALYSAMDAHQRKRNMTSAERTLSNIAKNCTVELKEKLSECV